jgi:hypothetical protein
MVVAMSVRLANDVVLELYCCVRQAALSLDRALSAGAWPSLREYYDYRRRSWISKIIHSAEPVVEAPRELALGGRERPRDSSLASIALAKLVGRFRHSVAFSGDDARFLTRALADLLKLLDSECYPGRDMLIALRLDLSTGETLLEHKAGSMPGLARCRLIEHFNQAPHLATVSLASLLPTIDQPHAHKAQTT